nr:insulin-like peptide [Crassostrea gigas]
MKWLLSVTFVSCLRVGVGSQLQACGSALTDILSLVCRNQFHAPAKRISDPMVNDIEELARYKRSRQFAVAQKRGGVVEECCFSSCSYENLLLYCSQSVDPLDVFTAARVGSSSTTTQRPITTTSTPTATTTPLSVLTVTGHKPEDQAELDEKAAAAAAWALSRRWFYVNRLGRFRGQVGRRIINM